MHDQANKIALRVGDDVSLAAKDLFARIIAARTAAFARFIPRALGSGLIDHNQKMTVAAMQMAEKNVCAHRS